MLRLQGGPELLSEDLEQIVTPLASLMASIRPLGGTGHALGLKD